VLVEPFLVTFHTFCCTFCQLSAHSVLEIPRIPLFSHGRHRLQGYLAHKKQPPPYDHHRANYAGPGPGFRKSGHAPKACWWSPFWQLSTHSVNFPRTMSQSGKGLQPQILETPRISLFSHGWYHLQGYLAHKKQPPPPGPPQDPRYSPAVGS